jgi:pilus assembly protein Flp/PilA
MRHFLKILRDRRGATAIEYALVAALIAVAAIAAFKNLGGQVNTTFNGVHGVMENATT